MARAPYLKQLAMIGTVLAAIFALAAAVQADGGFGAAGNRVGGRISVFTGTGPSNISASMGTLSSWRLTLIDCMAIGWLVCSIMAAAPRPRLGGDIGRCDTRLLMPICGHTIRSIRQTILHIQMPPPCR
ncbi:MAG: hypothetical protein ACP5O1_06115 [Phycisphaerae bacterium]